MFDPFQDGSATAVADDQPFDPFKQGLAKDLEKTSDVGETEKATARTAIAASTMPQNARLEQYGVDTKPPESSYVPGQYPIAENAAQAALELGKGMIPQTPGQYAKQLFPPLGAYEAFQHVKQGDLRDIPLVGRFQDIQEASKTPDWSKERFVAAGKTLMDVGLLAGLGEAKGGRLNASEIGKTETVPQYGVRPPVGEEAPLRQQGETPQAQTTETPPAQTILTKGGDLIEEKSQSPQQEEIERQTREGQQREQTPDQLGSEQPVLTSPSGLASQKTVETAAPSLIEPESLTEGAATPKTGVSAKAFENIYGEGEVPAGKSMSPEDIFTQGQVDLAAGLDPYSIADRARAGNVSPRELGLLAAEHHRLVTEASALEGTPQYEQAYQKARDFAQNMVKPAGTRWHQVGMGLQVEAPIDYSNLTGFRMAVEKRLGREIAPDEVPAFQKVAKDVAQAKREAQSSSIEAVNQVNRRFAKIKDISFDEAVKNLHDSIANAVRDCGL